MKLRSDCRHGEEISNPADNSEQYEDCAGSRDDDKKPPEVYYWLKQARTGPPTKLSRWLGFRGSVEYKPSRATPKLKLAIVYR